MTTTSSKPRGKAKRGGEDVGLFTAKIFLSSAFFLAQPRHPHLSTCTSDQSLYHKDSRSIPHSQIVAGCRCLIRVTLPASQLVYLPSLSRSSSSPLDTHNPTSESLPRHTTPTIFRDSHTRYQDLRASLPNTSDSVSNATSSFLAPCNTSQRPQNPIRPFRTNHLATIEPLAISLALKIFLCTLVIFTALSPPFSLHIAPSLPRQFHQSSTLKAARLSVWSVRIDTPCKEDLEL